MWGVTFQNHLKAGRRKRKKNREEAEQARPGGRIWSAAAKGALCGAPPPPRGHGTCTRRRSRQVDPALQSKLLSGCVKKSSQQASAPRDHARLSLDAHILKSTYYKPSTVPSTLLILTQSLHQPPYVGLRLSEAKQHKIA